MISQGEANALISQAKYFEDAVPLILAPGSKIKADLHSNPSDDRFVLDVTRASIKLTKVTKQLRTMTTVILVRLDLDGAPHTNPDGRKITGSHIHIYKEGFDDKWAYPIDREKFSNPSNLEQTFAEFCKFCNIKNPPRLQASLI